MKRLDEITIADLMPDSISGDAQVSATARAIDPQLRLISEAVDRPLILAAIDDLSAGVLEHLAVQYDVTAWDSAWPIETKRAVLKTAIADKRKKGTRGAVERAIEAVAPIATLTEWWQDTSGDMLPHTFKIDLLQDGSAVDPETQANVIAQVDEAKPVRSHYTFTAIQQAGSGLYFAGVLRAISYARVRSAGISIEQTNIDAGVLAALRGMNIRRLLASSHMGDMPEPVVPDVALFGGDFSGNNIRIDSVDGGGGLIDKFASYKALFNLRGWEPGGLFVDKPRMMGICGVLTETSDSMVLVEVPKQLSVGRIEFTGSLTEGGILESGVIEEYVPPTDYIDVNLGLRWDVDNGGWLAKTFAVNDWWWSGILSQSDLSRLQALGCDYCQTTNTSTAYPGLIGAVKYDDGFYYDLLELYDEIGEQPAPIASGFYFDERTSTADRDYTGCLVIYARYGYTRPIKSYKVRITKKEEYIDVILGFRWDTSLNDWRSINFDYALEDNNWWGCFISSDDATKISRYGVEVGSAGWLGDNGGLLYSDDFTFEVLEVYSELDQPVTGYDLSTFDIRSVSTSASSHMLSIFNTQRDATMLKFWKCRITRKVAPVLPTVETNLGAYGTYRSGTKSLAPNDIGVLYLRNASTTAVIYDDNYLYSVYRYYYDVLGASEWRIGAFFEAVKDGTALAAKNITNSTIDYIDLYRYATCSDNQAEVVTVLNASDQSFNAFKYTANGTDYYYVLDNTQTDWTDALSSIGYHLPPTNLIGYMTEGKAAVTVRTGSPRKMYDSSGNLIPFDSTRQYTMICYYSYDGGDPLEKPAQMGFTNVEGSLGLFATNSRSFTVQRVEYTES